MEILHLIDLFSTDSTPPQILDIAGHVLLLHGENPTTVSALTNVVLTARDSRVQRKAATVLIRLGESGFLAGRHLLFDSTQNIQSEVARAFCEWQTERARTLLFDFLREQPSKDPIYAGVTGIIILELIQEQWVESIPHAIALLSTPLHSAKRHGAELLCSELQLHKNYDLSAASDVAYALHTAEPDDLTWLHLLAWTGDLRALEPLIAQLDMHSDLLECYQVLLSLGFMRDSRAADAVLPFVDHEEFSLRRGAANALGRIGDPRAIVPLCEILKQEAIHTHIQQLWKEADQEEVDNDKRNPFPYKKVMLQNELATALVRLNVADAQQEMLNCMYFEDSDNGVDPQIGLCLLGQAIVPALIKIITEGTDILDCIPACYALATIGNVPHAIDPLIRLLSAPFPEGHREEQLRAAAADALGTLGDKLATLPLCSLLPDTRWLVESSVRNALKKLADPDAVPALVKHLTTERGIWLFNLYVLPALLACGRETAFPLLAERYRTETDEHERIALALALAWLNDKQALSLLQAHASGTDSPLLQTTTRCAINYLELAPSHSLPQW